MRRRSPLQLRRLRHAGAQAGVRHQRFRRCPSRAHARTGDPSFIGCLGSGKAFAQAISDFAVAYADQTERDHQALMEAVKSERIAGQTGI